MNSGDNNIELFRTIVSVDPLSTAISSGARIMSMGSCFAEHMAANLDNCGFRVVSNPSGTLYNPASVAALVTRLLRRHEYTEDELFEHLGVWRSFDHHSSYAAKDRAAALARINADFATGADALAYADWLLITFGTAAVFVRQDDPARTVANCHKLPERAFVRRLLSVQEIVGEWGPLLQRLREVNPSVHVLFTVSPVRHLRDNAHANQISKATLLLAVDELLGADKCDYFPAYEIMMDELRDYRFCDRDMAHPNEQARDYIWDRFVDSCLTDEAARLVAESAAVRKAMRHRPLTDDAASTRAFAEQQLQKIHELAARYPNADLSRVDRHFRELAKS